MNLVLAILWVWQSFFGQRPIQPENISGSYDVTDKAGVYLGQKVISPDLDQEPLAVVLGANSLEKRIEVDLTNQKVYAFEGDKKVFEFLISSGKWGRTPTGTFKIWGKFKNTKMSGGNSALGTYYYLPNVPYVMFFANDKVAASRGFSFHGTYWHNNFGYPMSHGCVNMRTEDAKTLFYWTQPSAESLNAIRASKDDPGTEVAIYGVPPEE